MIRVCILNSPTVPGVELQELLDNLGFQTSIGPPIVECDVILADSKVADAKAPTVIYTKQDNLRHVLVEAVVAERFRPLNNVIVEGLDLCKKG